VSEGIDHAGLLALRVPRPTLLGVARFDFFPIEGAKETFAEAQRLYEVAGAGDRVALAEAAERHGLTLPLRTAVYPWFDRWLAGREKPAPVVEPPVARNPVPNRDREGAGRPVPAAEIPVARRPDKELLVCDEGQVNQTFRSRPLLPMAWEDFERKPRPARIPL